MWKLSPSNAGALLGKNPYKTVNQALAYEFKRQRPTQWKEAMDMLEVEKTSEEIGKEGFKNLGLSTKCTVDASTCAARKSFETAVNNALDKQEAGRIYTRQGRRKRDHERKLISSAATKEVYTETGKAREAGSMAKSARKYGRTYSAGNAKWYTLIIPGLPLQGRMWGKIDGFEEATGTLIEAKERQNRFLGHDTVKKGGEHNYERVQIFIYMKMLKCTKAKLVETFEEEQREHDIQWDDEEWEVYYKGLQSCVARLNEAFVDLNARLELAKSLTAS